MSTGLGIGGVAAVAAAAAAGLAVGAVVGGGRLVRTYDWATEWTVDAAPADVYALFERPEEQARWWPSMVVVRTTGGTAGGTTDSAGGAPTTVTYRVIQAPSVRRFAPPFVITSTRTDAEPGRRIRAVVTGDLVGVLDTHLYEIPEGGTRVVFNWYVRLPNPVLNLAGYVATRVYRASHDHVMREGEAGLRAYFARRAAGTIGGRAEPEVAGASQVAIEGASEGVPGTRA
jgi:uncharacterized protein YndB with AHSA1/START domain